MAAYRGWTCLQATTGRTKTTKAWHGTDGRYTGGGATAPKMARTLAELQKKIDNLIARPARKGGK